MLIRALENAGFEVVRQRRAVEVFPVNSPPSVVDRAAATLACWRYRKTGYVHAVLARPAGSGVR